MGRFKKIPIAAFTLLFLLSYNIKAVDKSADFKIGKEFRERKLKLDAGSVIIDYCKDDINGDNIKDNILLVGTESKSHIGMKDNIKIILQDGKSKEYYKISPGKIESGYNGKIFLGDFNGDKILDIFISMYSEENGEACSFSIVSFKENKSVYLFEQEYFSKGLLFNINYEDKFKANLFSKDLVKYYCLDLSNKKSTYIAEGVYDRKGKLLKKQQGESEGLNELTPIDIDKDGVYEFKAIQRLRGICNSDTIGYVKAIWKYEKTAMKLVSLEILPYAKTGELQRIRRVVPVGNFGY